jgi:hypothetical protein
MILKEFTFFIIKDIIRATEAKYPTHSVIEIPKIIVYKIKS